MIWRIVLSIIAAVITAPIYHGLIFSRFYKNDGDKTSFAEKFGYCVLIVALSIIYYIAIDNTIKGGDGGQEHFYPDQWEPVL